MGLLDYNLDNVPEEAVAEKGEYEIKLNSCESKPSQAGDPMLRAVITIPEEADVPDIFHYIMLPKDDDTEKDKNNKLRRLLSFLECFGISHEGGFDPETLGGQTGYAMIKVTESDEYGKQNAISRFLKPR